MHRLELLAFLIDWHATRRFGKVLSRRPVNKDGISTRGLKILVEKQNNRFAPSYLQKMERTKASLKVKAKGGSAWSRRLCICCNVLARVVVCVGKGSYAPVASIAKAWLFDPVQVICLWRANLIDQAVSQRHSGDMMSACGTKHKVGRSCS